MFTRLFNSILDSSLNVQSVPLSARWLWITMLLIADDDRTGVVDMPIERLAARAGLSLQQTTEALRILGSPDPDSSSPEEEGRRVVPLRDASSRGWRLVNWEKYREVATAEHRREQTRQRVADYRKRTETGQGLTNSNDPLPTHSQGPEIAAVGGKRSKSKGPDALTGMDLPLDGLGAIEIVHRTIAVIAPASKLIDDVEVSLWLRDINPDPWWIAAAICEAQASLQERSRSARYVRGIIKRYAEEGQVFEDAKGYVSYIISPERANKLNKINTSTM